LGQTGKEQEVKKTPRQMGECAYLPSVVNDFKMRMKQRLVELDLHVLHTMARRRTRGLVVKEFRVGTIS
jgi:hypothetical protein